MPDWVESSIDFLVKHQHKDGGWSYFGGADSAIEPTATAVAALTAHQKHPDICRNGLTFIDSLQGPDGALRPQPSQPDATTLGAYAGIVNAYCTPEQTTAKRIADYLLSYDPETAPKVADLHDDSTLRGFAWRKGTYSWVEPTAYGIILLERLGRGTDPRVAEARRLLLDRALPGGGWNYGNTIVFGTTLEPAVMPSAVALLALHDETSSAAVTNGITYLKSPGSIVAAEGVASSPAQTGGAVPRGAGVLKPATELIPSVLSLAWRTMALRARGVAAALPGDFGTLLTKSRRSAKSPWHHAAALLAVAPLGQNAFVLGAKA